MRFLTILRVVAIGCAGLLAGIYFGDRAGAYYARTELTDSSVVQFQQVVHVHYLRFMPPLVTAALLGGIRAFVATGVLLLEAVALSLAASSGRA